MDNKTVKFSGKIMRCIYNSQDFKVYAFDVNTFQYPEVKLSKYGNVSILGDLPELTQNIEYEVTASEQDSKYGTSYRVINIRCDAPTTTEDVRNFLCEILTENQADVLIQNYPDIIDRVKNNQTNDIDLTKLKGIGEKTFANIKDKIMQNFYLMDLVVEFKNVLSLSMLKKIYNQYSSVEILKEKLKSCPYITLTRISGVGFKKADEMIIKMQKENIIDFGYDVKNSVDRCLACILYLLEENENEGHTKTNLANLRAECIKTVPECSDHFTEAIKDESVYYNKETMDIAIKKTYETEQYIADTIFNAMMNNHNTWDYPIEQYQKNNQFDLTDEQINAIKNVCKYSVSILNGPAGTGKSFTTKSVINMLKDHHKSFRLLAPTGKAAKVLASYTSETASTIHRGLCYNPSFPDPWIINKDNPLIYDIIIVDEFSMVDINLFYHLLDAIDFRSTKLLIIGDNAQLPSVGCGNLLHDFMQTKLIPTTTLTKVFRYVDGGLMKIATDVRYCKPYLDSSMKSKATVFGDNKDYLFVDLPSEQIPSHAVALYKKLLDSGNHIEDIQVLTAKNVGDCGTIVLNNMIQKIANKNYGSETHMDVGEVTYYIGDLVIQTQNNYKAKSFVDDNDDDIDEDDRQTLFIANGESGIIKDINRGHIIIDFDGVLVDYERNDMNMVRLGYSVSIHKSQGSSVDNVILCTPQSHTFMLNSNIIYVGLTRMRKKCFHLGTMLSVNKAVKKKENFNRNTFMQQLLKSKYDDCKNKNFESA